ncbi:hypothetical protein IscW_ISCW014354, partial [Ixodes scapularis]
SLSPTPQGTRSKCALSWQKASSFNDKAKQQLSCVLRLAPSASPVFTISASAASTCGKRPCPTEVPAKYARSALIAVTAAPTDTNFVAGLLLSSLSLAGSASSALLPQFA